MRMDLHVHTHHSAYGGWRYDAIGSPRQVLERARRVGLDCVAITDHDTVNGATEALEIARSMEGIDVIPGIEVSSRDGHVVALNVTTKIPSGMTAEDTAERIHERGGLAVAAHPTRSSGVTLDSGVEFDAVEAWNARSSRRENETAARIADERAIPVIASSDAHHWKDVGRAYTVIEGDDPLSGIVDGPVALYRGEMSTRASARLYASKVIHNVVGPGPRAR